MSWWSTEAGQGHFPLLNLIFICNISTRTLLTSFILQKCGCLVFDFCYCHFSHQSLHTLHPHSWQLCALTLAGIFKTVDGCGDIVFLQPILVLFFGCESSNSLMGMKVEWCSIYRTPFSMAMGSPGLSHSGRPSDRGRGRESTFLLRPQAVVLEEVLYVDGILWALPTYHRHSTITWSPASPQPNSRSRKSPREPFHSWTSIVVTQHYDGSLSTTVFWKKTHTGRTLDWGQNAWLLTNSNCPFSAWLVWYKSFHHLIQSSLMSVGRREIAVLLMEKHPNLALNWNRIVAWLLFCNF